MQLDSSYIENDRFRSRRPLEYRHLHRTIERNRTETGRDFGAVLFCSHTVKSSYKFRCGQRRLKTNVLEDGKLRPPRRLVLRRRCPYRKFTDSYMALSLQLRS